MAACDPPPLPPPVTPTPPPSPPVVPPAPPPAPGTPPGVAQLNIDLANSTVIGDDYSANNVITLQQIAQVGYKVAAQAASLVVYVQNVGTASGSMSIGVSVNDGGAIVTPATTQSLTVGAKSTGYVGFSLQLVGGYGSYEFTIDNGTAKHKFIVAFNGPPPTGAGA